MPNVVLPKHMTCSGDNMERNARNRCEAPDTVKGALPVILANMDFTSLWGRPFIRFEQLRECLVPWRGKCRRHLRQACWSENWRQQKHFPWERWQEALSLHKEIGAIGVGDHSRVGMPVSSREIGSYLLPLSVEAKAGEFTNCCLSIYLEPSH